MYEKRTCLTGKEAWELGIHTAHFVGMSKRDMQLFDAVLMVQIRDYIYQKARRKIPMILPALEEGPQSEENLSRLVR